MGRHGEPIAAMGAGQSPPGLKPRDSPTGRWPAKLADDPRIALAEWRGRGSSTWRPHGPPRCGTGRGDPLRRGPRLRPVRHGAQGRRVNRAKIRFSGQSEQGRCIVRPHAGRPVLRLTRWASLLALHRPRGDAGNTTSTTVGAGRSGCAGPLGSTSATSEAHGQNRRLPRMAPIPGGPYSDRGRRGARRRRVGEALRGPPRRRSWPGPERRLANFSPPDPDGMGPDPARKLWPHWAWPMDLCFYSEKSLYGTGPDRARARSICAGKGA